MQETINEIVDASDAPLSILIVGIGNSNLTNMHKLDDEDNPLRSSDGKLMKRSIVKFVPFNEFKDYSSTKLENEILEEIPFQIHQFCSTHGFIPTFEKSNFSCFL